MIALTLAGRFVAWLAGASPVIRRGEAVLYAVKRGSWLYRWFFKRFEVAAFTWGASILARVDLILSESLIAHELIHVEQAHRYGITLPLVYAWFSLVAVCRGGNAYYDNVLEAEARERSGR